MDDISVILGPQGQDSPQEHLGPTPSAPLPSLLGLRLFTTPLLREQVGLSLWEGVSQTPETWKKGKQGR
jgi:hypothetical protein